MSQADSFNAQQAAFWNGAMGQTWVDTQKITDAMLAPAADVLVAEAQALRPRRVLDIGCGNGTTTRALADALPEADQITGIDISQAMMGHAQAISDATNNRASFIAADAAAYAYRPAHFDLLVSRFGSMFFGDQKAALRHLHTAMVPGGQLCFVVWDTPDANAFLTEGARAAAGLLPDAPPRPENAPGPFAMADETKVTGHLTAAGWSDVRFDPVTFRFGFPKRYLDMFTRNLAPIGPGLDELPETTRDAVFKKARAAFGAYVSKGRLEFDAGCLVIRARANG